eukprot:UN01653
MDSKPDNHVNASEKKIDYENRKYFMDKIPTYKQCLDEVYAKHVRKAESPCGHYSIFCYKQDLPYTGGWNSINLWCRGLIF